MDSPGIEIRPIMQMTGTADFNEVFFTDVRIPATNIVGKRGEGWKVANATLAYERGSLADPNVMMNRMYALIDLMKSETIDGERVIDKPAFRDRTSVKKTSLKSAVPVICMIGLISIPGLSMGISR